MNPIFSSEGQGWPKFPRASYGRLEQTEPIVLAGATEALFAFDVVDADWAELGPSGQFDLSDAPKILKQQQQYWQGLFGKSGASQSSDPYDSAPIYRIEVTSRRGDLFFDVLTQMKESDWFRIELDQTGSFEVDVFGGLFAAPVQAYLTGIAGAGALAPALTAAFDMDAWPDASIHDIALALSGVGHLNYLVAYDVGQGSANGLSDVAETVQMFFDLGCGVYRNRMTRPVPLRFCWRGSPPIVLSHWDGDHWAGEMSDPQAAGRTWIAPRQTISFTHTAFAIRVLRAGGTIHIWGAAPSRLAIHLPSGQILVLARCSGNDRNGSGISCVVVDSDRSRGWLLTGDAGYHELNQPSLPVDLRAVVVPHHGANMGAASIPPAPPTGYARLLYSFGPGNKHGRTHVQHPTSAGVNAHVVQGWNHGNWLVAMPANCVAGADVLASATHPHAHLGGSVAGWTGAPIVPFATVPCAGVPAAPGGCTGQIVQA